MSVEPVKQSERGKTPSSKEKSRMSVEPVKRSGHDTTSAQDILPPIPDRLRKLQPKAKTPYDIRKRKFNYSYFIFLYIFAFIFHR